MKKIGLLLAASILALSAHAEISHSSMTMQSIVVPTYEQDKVDELLGVEDLRKKFERSQHPVAALHRSLLGELSHGMCFYCGRGMCKWSPCQGNV